MSRIAAPMLRDALLLVLIDVAVGLPMVFGAAKWVSSLLFGARPQDPAAVALEALLTLLSGALLPACAPGHARRSHGAAEV